jgi:hypothetical protein
MVNIMVLNENKLKNIIRESIETYLFEEQLKNEIKNIVRESLENFGGMAQFESEDSEYSEHNEDDERLSDMNTESDDEKETRDSIEAFFKQPGVNNAPYAYSLYGVDAKEGQDTNEMKNARKKFADCLNHEKNENGYPYSFSSEQLNHLKGMISSNDLS